MSNRFVIDTMLIGRSPAIEGIRRLILELADTPASILIVGETGTGKELVARCLHAGGSSRTGNFVALNCGGVPESLFESEILWSRAWSLYRCQQAAHRQDRACSQGHLVPGRDRQHALRSAGEALACSPRAGDRAPGIEHTNRCGLPRCGSRERRSWRVEQAEPLSGGSLRIALTSCQSNCRHFGTGGRTSRSFLNTSSFRQPCASGVTRRSSPVRKCGNCSHTTGLGTYVNFTTWRSGASSGSLVRRWS